MACDRLLQEPSARTDLRLLADKWQARYPFSILSSFTAMRNQLASLAGDSTRVALVASFTESPGVPNKPEDPDNLRIGFPLTSGFDLYRDEDVGIPWLMSTSEYRAFWTGGRSNSLDRVASIYGAQGFESDYVGVVWGRDLLIRDGQWILGDPNHCYDRIDKLVTGRVPRHRWAGEALQLVLNRYRIFLTRGIRGTLIFCEDEETREYLKTLIRPVPER